MTKTPKPVAVIISDVHYSLATLNVADEAFNTAISAAHELKVPLIDCGDLTNDKAIIRAEVANRLIKTFSRAKELGVEITALVGNHSLVNEKSSEHALHFLEPFATVIDKTTVLPDKKLVFVPYFNTSFSLLDGYTYIMHTGLKGADMGHYVVDKTSISPTFFSGLRVISGHYHKAQDIELEKNGLFSYVGNPYTLGFGEANHPPKGYAILYSDGTLKRIPLNLRKHIVVTVDKNYANGVAARQEDIVLVKYRLKESEMPTYTKQVVAEQLRLEHLDFTLQYEIEKSDLTDLSKKRQEISKLKDEDMVDSFIEMLPESEQYKTELKSFWRQLYDLKT